MELIALNIPCVTELNVGNRSAHSREELAGNQGNGTYREEPPTAEDAMYLYEITNSGENDIGDAGVEIIADYLRDLNYLYLCTEGLK